MNSNREKKIKEKIMMNDNDNNDNRDDNIFRMTYYFTGRNRSIADIGDSVVQSMRRPPFKWRDDYRREWEELRRREALLEENQKQVKKKNKQQQNNNAI